VGTPLLLVSHLGAHADDSQDTAPAAAGSPIAAPPPPMAPDYTPAEQQAFQDFTADAAEYANDQSEYHQTLGAIIKRTYQQQKSAMQQRYQSELDTLRQETDENRQDAIVVLQQFLKNYPNDATWTPDVEFRLAMLYFDVETDDKTNGADVQPTSIPALAPSPFAPLATEGLPSTAPSSQPTVLTYYPRTIALLLDLITRFPSYRLIDQAEFALGYCLNQTDTPPEAMPFFRAAVCPNKYKPLDPPPLLVGDDAYAESVAEHRLAPNPPPPLPADVYDNCQPLDPKSPVLQETWIRIGEFHFDNTGQLQAAEQAYQHASEVPGDQYGFALYKWGWAYYRDNQFTNAITKFDQDVMWSDDQVKQGKDPSDTRDEAVRYIAFCFQDQDWNNDGQTDTEQGYDRAENFYNNRWQQPHVREVYLSLAKLYHQYGEYLNSAKTYELVEKHWPNAPDAPQIQETIAEEYSSAHDEASATNSRETLGLTYGTDGSWAKANVNNPDAIDRAQDLARNSLLIGADGHRQKGLGLLQAASTTADAATQHTDYAAAVVEFALAADAYQAYVRRYPNSPDIYKVWFVLAQSFDGAGSLMPQVTPAGYPDVLARYQAIMSGPVQSTSAPASFAAASPPASQPVVRNILDPDYNTQLRTFEEQAAEGYEWVRDNHQLAPANYDQSQKAADFACSVREGVVTQDQALGQYTVPAKPDNASNKPNLPIQPQTIPDDVQKLQADYDAYAQAYPNDVSDQTSTPAKMIDAALISYEYLHWDDDKGPKGAMVPGARTRFQAIRDAYCGKAKEADDAGQALLGSYVIENNLDQMDFWAKKLQDQKCGTDLSQSPQLTTIVAGVSFKKADDLMQKGNCTSDTPDATICPEAAQSYLDIVKSQPGYEHNALAVQNAAVAYEHLHQYDKSISLYEQLFDPKGPYASSKEVDVPAAIFFAASDHKRFFEFDDALREYKMLFDPKYKSSPYQLQAMISAALLEQSLQQYNDSASLYVQISNYPGVTQQQSVDAYQSAATCYQSANEPSQENGALSELINRARSLPAPAAGQPGGGDYVVRAEYRQSEIADAQGSHQTALSIDAKVVQDYQTFGLPQNGAGAEYAAHAFFNIAQDNYNKTYKTKSLSFNPNDSDQTHAQRTVQNNEAAALACENSFVPLYAAVLSTPPNPPPTVEFNRPTWMFAGWYMAGQCWQDLGDLYQNAPLPDALSQFAQEAQDAYTQAINNQVTKYDNAAQAIWKSAIQIAQQTSVSNDWTKAAIKQMNGYDPTDYPMIKDPKVDLAASAPGQ
jgi:hypothetical protein